MCLQGVLADVSIATGYVTIALMVSGRFIFQYLGWATAAFITPTVLMLFGGAFFLFTLSGNPATAKWAVLAGAVTQVRAHAAMCHSCRTKLCDRPPAPAGGDLVYILRTVPTLDRVLLKVGEFIKG